MEVHWEDVELVGILLAGGALLLFVGLCLVFMLALFVGMVPCET